MGLISIVLPVYGVEQYIRNTIKSICMQTCQDFELIIVDDGCVDNSIPVALDEINSHDISFDYEVIRQSNAGVSSARNTGIRNAKNEWIICVDSDDIIHPDTIAVLTKCIEHNDNLCNIIWFDFLYVKKCPVVFPKINDNSINIVNFSREQILYNFLTRKNRLIVTAAIVRRSFILENKLFYNQDCYFSEDVLMIWEYLLSSNGIQFVDHGLYYYLIRPGSTMTSSKKEKILTGFTALSSFNERLRFLCVPSRLSKWLLPRWVLGALRSSAKMVSFQDFKYLEQKMNYEYYMTQLKDFPDIKARTLSVVLKTSSYLFYRLARMV